MVGEVQNHQEADKLVDAECRNYLEARTLFAAVVKLQNRFLKEVDSGAAVAPNY